jgi:hypothetical protein
MERMFSLALVSKGDGGVFSTPWVMIIEPCFMLDNR